MQRVDIEGVLADKPRRHVAFQRLQCGGYNIVVETLSPARDPLVDMQLDKQMILTWKTQAGKLFNWRSHVLGNADIVGLDGCNFHQSILAASCLAVLR